MIFRAVVKTGMVDQILSAVLVDERRVMSGRHVRAFQGRKLVIAGQLQTVKLMIHIRSRVFPVHVHIIAVHGLGTKHAHLITAAARERTIGNIQIIVSGRLVIENVRRFDRFMSTAEQLFPIIRIHIVFFICLRMDHLTGRGINFQ